jgi:hypothetical protein
MKAFILAALVALAIPSAALAQEKKEEKSGIEFGVGITAPLTQRNIITEAHNDTLGVTRVDRALDGSPQILVELHKTYKVNKSLAVGPMIAFTPKIDMGLTSNTATEQPLGAGFGFIVQIPSKLKQHINVGAMWLITAPVDQLAPGWQDGFQAPRNGQFGLPMNPEFTRASVHRICLVMTVSGFLR